MMDSEMYLFAFSMINTGAILLLLIYYILTLSDLECDYLNAQQCCSKLNFWVLPRIVAYSIQFLVLLLNGHWILAKLNLPIIFWQLHIIYKTPKGNLGVYDPTEIHQKGEFNRHLRNSLIHAGFYFVSLFVYFYSFIMAMLSENPIKHLNQPTGLEYD